MIFINPIIQNFITCCEFLWVFLTNKCCKAVATSLLFRNKNKLVFNKCISVPFLSISLKKILFNLKEKIILNSFGRKPGSFKI